MKKYNKITIVVAIVLLSLLVTGTVFAASVGYSVTLPAFGGSAFTNTATKTSSLTYGVNNNSSYSGSLAACCRIYYGSTGNSNLVYFSSGQAVQLNYTSFTVGYNYRLKLQSSNSELMGTSCIGNFNAN